MAEEPEAEEEPKADEAQADETAGRRGAGKALLSECSRASRGATRGLGRVRNVSRIRSVL